MGFPETEPSNQKQQLLQEIAQSRTAIGRDYTALLQELDMGAKFQAAVKARPAAWLGGAALAGFLVAGGFGGRGRSRREAKRRSEEARGAAREGSAVRSLGFWGGLLALLRFLGPLLKPAIQVYATKKLSALAESLK